MTRLAATLLLLLSPLLAAADAGARLYWLAPEDAALQEAFVQEWQRRQGSAPKLLDHPMDTLLTVAPHGAEIPGERPVVWLQVPRNVGPAAANQSGVYREASPAALLNLWKELLPELGPAGLLVGAHSRGLWPSWRTEARQRGLNLKPGFVRASEQAHRVYGLLRPSIALLLYSSEMATHDSIAVSVILRESLSSGLPVLGTERSLLPAGALAVLQQPAEALGKQAADIALALLRGEQPGWQEPQNLTTEVNYQVARTLQLPLAGAATASRNSENDNTEAKP